MAVELKEWIDDERDSEEGITLDALWEEMSSIFAENTGEDMPIGKRKWLCKRFESADCDKNGVIRGDKEVNDLVAVLQLLPH